MLRLLCLVVLAAGLAACDSKSEAELLSAAQAQLDKRDPSGATIHLKNVLEQRPDSAKGRLLMGRALLMVGDPAHAAIELRRAQDLGSAQEDVAPDLARALLRAGDFNAVAAQFGAVALSTPSANAELQSIVAEAMAAQGFVDKARDLLEQVLRAAPDQPSANLTLAKLDAASGELQAALDRLAVLIRRDPANDGAGLLMGELLAARGDMDGALAAFRALRLVRPDLAAAQAAIVNTLLKTGKGLEARAELETLKKLAPRHLDLLLLQAQIAFDDKDYKTCRDLMQRLLTIAPRDMRVLLVAAAADYSLHQYATAEGHLITALQLTPDYLPARHLLAQTYIRTGQAEKALKVVQSEPAAVAAEPTSLRLAGEALLQLGDAKGAEAAFDRAAKAAPADKRLKTAVAVAQLAQGQTQVPMQQLEALAKSGTDIDADMALISAHLRSNDLKAALTAVDNLVSKASGEAFPLVLKGRVQIQQGDLASAASSFSEALARDANNLAALMGQIDVDLRLGKPDQAKERLDRLIRANPKNYRARLERADLEMRLGAPDSAVLGQLRAAIKTDGSQPQAHLKAVELLLIGGDIQSAQIAAQEGAAALPGNFEILEALGRTQLAAGEHQSAITTFKRLSGQRPRQSLPLLRLAEAHAAARETGAAKAAIAKALTLAPDDQGALRWQAILAVVDGQRPKAVEMARAAQRKHPAGAFGYALEGELAAQAEDWPAAAEAYTKAWQRDRSTELIIKRHDATERAGRAAQAERLAAEWLSSNPKDAKFLYYLGDSASSRRDWPGAEARYRAVLALRPQHAAAMNNVAWLLAKQGKSGAVAMAERAVSLLPQRAGLLDTLAFALHSERELAKAVEVQTRAVELDAKEPMLRWRLAQLLVENGDKSAARKHLEVLASMGTRFAGQAEVNTLLKTL